MTSQHLAQELQKNPFVLAPMAGITDRAFRSFMREMGCGVVITELISATGLKFSSEKTRRLMEFDEGQHPVGIQLFGEDLEHLAYAAQVVEQMGADFVDLNFGCPVPKVVNKGGGSAVLRDLTQVRKVFRAVKSAVQIPVTVKVRTGWDQVSRNTPQLAQVASDEGLAWIAIHGRTRAQGYSGRADWDYIREVKENGPIPVIGNGDIASAKQAVARLKESGCDGVMIGRGCLKNPWIFQEAMALWAGQEIGVQRNFVSSFDKLETHLQAHSPERIVMLQLRKFAAWFSAGYPNASTLRKQIFADASLSELRQKIHDFFGPLSAMKPEDTSHEPFLMGGHG
ncbi:MAG: tRNA dihydrouridine synthase DusB [Bdellovibrionales bacterium]